MRKITTSSLGFLNFSFFILKRIIASGGPKGNASHVIFKIGILAITLGLASMIVAVCVGTGLQKEIQDKLVTFNGHIQIVSYDGNLSDTFEVPIQKDSVLLQSLSHIKEVTSISPIALKSGIIRTKHAFEGIIAKGIDHTYNWDYLKSSLSKGRFPNLNRDISNEVIISETLSKRLKLRVGDVFNAVFFKDESKMPNQRLFRIVGLYHTGFEEADALYIFADIRQIQKINNWKSYEVGAFEVRIDEFGHLEKASNEVYKKTPPLLDVRTIVSKYNAIFDWLALFDYNILIITIIMIVVGSINMITVLLVLILERTQTIGILKSLGCSNMGIQRIFLYYAAYLIALGLFFGNLLGLGLMFAQKYWSILKLDPKIYYVSEAPVDINFVNILGLSILTFLVCLGSLFLPSLVVQKVSPVKAIKFH